MKNLIEENIQLSKEWNNTFSKTLQNWYVPDIEKHIDYSQKWVLKLTKQVPISELLNINFLKPIGNLDGIGWQTQNGQSLAITRSDIAKKYL